jgi:predicted nucleic acid-binding protein
MKEILVDTNVLVSFLTDRNKAQQEQAAALFHGAADREHTLVLHSITLVEMVHVFLQIYKSDPLEVAHALGSLLEMPGVVTVEDVTWSQVLERWPRVIPGFGDAIVATVAHQGRHDAVATFDAGLKKKLVQQGTVLYWPQKQQGL